MIADLEAYYRVDPAPADRAWVIVSMIASVDGGTAVGGVSGPLGHPTDQQVLRLVHAAADVILVAAGTVRAEQYRPVREPKRLVIVTASGNLGTAAAVADAPNTEIVQPSAGQAGVEPAALVGRFPGKIVVCEGGPSLNGQLLGAGLVDEVFVTLSPRLLAGDSARLAHGPMDASSDAWELRHVLQEDGFLFLRYRSRRSDSARARSAGTAD